MAKKVYMTMFWNKDLQAGEPIKVYAKEEDAKMAVEKSSAARRKLDELWDQLVKPYSCSYVSGSREEKAHPFPSKDGHYYSTEKGALYGDKRADFYALEEVKEYQRQNTKEDYYEPIDFCE